LLSTDARKLNETHNPNYMETSIIDFFWGFVIAASWTFEIRNLSKLWWTNYGKNINLNLCKCTNLNIKIFKYFEIRNLSKLWWTNYGKHINLNLCKCTNLNIKIFKYKYLHGH
jgi:hypothetical protein